MMLRYSKFWVQISHRTRGVSFHTSGMVTGSYRKVLLGDRSTEMIAATSRLSSQMSKLTGFYDRQLERHFPAFYKIYRIYKDGIKGYWNEGKALMKLKISSKNINDYTLDEIILTHKLPQEISRLVPVLLFACLPFCQYLILPLAYKYPRRLMTYHFWTPEQQRQFAIEEHAERLPYYNAVLRQVRSALAKTADGDQKALLSQLIEVVENGGTARPDLLSRCIPLFSDKGPLSLSAISASHVTDLLRMHGMRVGWIPWSRRAKLDFYANTMHYMDFTLAKSKKLIFLTDKQFRVVCSMRGMNPASPVDEQMEQWFQQWLAISKCVMSQNYSLLLHSPLFLSYNQACNKQQ